MKNRKPRGFNEQELAAIGSVYVKRISTYDGGIPSLMEDFGDELPTILYVWSNYGDRTETNQRISEWLETSPEAVIPFLISYLPTSLDVEIGLWHKSDLDRDFYESIIQVVDAENIIVALEKVFGAAIYTEGYPELADGAIELICAQQFAWLYRNIQASEG